MQQLEELIMLEVMGTSKERGTPNKTWIETVEMILRHLVRVKTLKT